MTGSNASIFPTRIIAPSLTIIWRILESQGMDPELFFKDQGIDPALVKNPMARVSQEKAVKLLKAIVEATDNPCIWLQAEDYWHPSSLGVLGYAWLASSSLRTAFMRFQRYIRLLTDAREVVFKEDETTFRLILPPDQTDANLYGRDMLLVIILISMCRMNYGPEFAPVKVELAQTDPECRNEYDARFRCPIRFNAPETCLTIAKSILDKELPGSNPELAKLSDEVMIQRLADLDKQDIVNRVRAAIISQLPSGEITEASVAEALYINLRTLQRKLEQESASFRSILDTVRHQLALRYIDNSSYSLTEITFLLGFSSSSSFSRAFKRWTGMKPSERRSST